MQTIIDLINDEIDKLGDVSAPSAAFSYAGGLRKAIEIIQATPQAIVIEEGTDFRRQVIDDVFSTFPATVVIMVKEESDPISYGATALTVDAAANDLCRNPEWSKAHSKLPIDIQKQLPARSPHTFERFKLIGETCSVILMSLNEGHDGDYDPENPFDESLIRFSLGNGKEGYGYCTAVPVTIGILELEAMARTILNAVESADGTSTYTVAKQFEGMTRSQIMWDGSQIVWDA
jgi:hypothetical protein